MDRDLSDQLTSRIAMVPHETVAGDRRMLKRRRPSATGTWTRLRARRWP